MKILAFDVSSDVLSVAVFEGTKKLAFYEAPTKKSHSEMLALYLEKVLKSARTKLSKIDCVAVGIGPGSFTGVRIGVTTAKILAYTLKIKLIGIPSLEAMARSVDRDGTYAVIADARRSQVYGAIYRRKNGEWKTLTAPALFFREDFLKSLTPEAVRLESVIPSASAIAAAALDRIQTKKWDDALKLTPLYLRPKDCNVTLKK